MKNQPSCDRLVIEGRRVKILRRDDTHKELVIGIRQFLRLFRAGLVVEELLVESKEEFERE